MKIGILTFHCAHNYGAVLQCYATQEFLRSKGFDVEIINYRPQFLLEPYKILNSKRVLCKRPILFIKKLLKEILFFRLRYKRWKGFEKFINTHLILSERFDKISIPSRYDIYIVGSDQIWNNRITNGDDVYFCKFPFAKGNKKYISYAASMETTTLDNNTSYKNLLNSFDAISVREENIQALLTPYTNLTIQHVLDPTLMASSKIWESFPSKTRNKDKYVVVYQVAENKNTIRIARHIAKQIGAKVKILVARIGRNTSEKFQDATPEEFVDTIRNAACIVTTSFHGTAFSVIFNRPFYTIKLNNGWDTRSSSLLNSIGLKNRIIDKNDSPQFSTIDYSHVNEKLEILQKESQDFILNQLIPN